MTAYWLGPNDYIGGTRAYHYLNSRLKGAVNTPFLYVKPIAIRYT